jgi:hypothetical protein
MEQKFQMNDILQDKISGFKGQVQGITHYDTGCIHYGLAALKLKTDGTIHDWQWFDTSRLNLVKSAPVIKVQKPHSGPDMNPRMQ